MRPAPTCDVTGILAYEPDLRGFVERRVSHREDAADVCQEVLVRAHVMLPHFKGRSHPRTWLLSIARHIIVDYYRRKRFLPLDSNSPAIPQLGRQLTMAADSSVVDQCEARERITQCLQCITTILPVPEQVTILLCEVYGYSDNEAADILGMTTGRLKHMLRRARADLRDARPNDCGMIAKTGAASECARPSRLSAPTKERTRGASTIRIAARYGKRHSIRLVRLRDRLLRDVLRFDLHQPVGFRARTKNSDRPAP